MVPPPGAFKFKKKERGEMGNLWSKSPTGNIVLFVDTSDFQRFDVFALGCDSISFVSLCTDRPLNKIYRGSVYRAREKSRAVWFKI